MSDRVIGTGRGGKFAILVEISGRATKSAVENLFAEIRHGARRAGLSAKVVWPRKAKKGKKARKKK